MKTPLVVSIAMLCCVAGLDAQSFDCAKARSALERTICGDRALGAADQELNAAWRGTLRAFPLPAFLRNSQQMWLKEVALCAGATPHTCLRPFRERAALLRDIAAGRVYSDYGRTLSIDGLTLVVFEKTGERFLWMSGLWMPDMSDPEPPPFGFLLNDVSRLVAKGGDTYTLEGWDHEVRFNEESILFPEPLMVSARQPQIEGALQRVR